jgi:hypothetical protein
MFFRKLYAASAVSLLALITAYPAQAEIDAQKVADAVKAQFSNMGLSITAAGAELQGANVVLKDLTFMPAGTPDAEAAKLGDVTLENVTENAGGYVVSKISAPARSITNPDGTFEFGGATITNVKFGGAAATDPIAAAVFYESFTTGPMKFVAEGAEVFRMDGIELTVSPYVAGAPLKTDLKFNNIYGNFSTVPDPQAKQVLTDLGLLEVKGNVFATGSWNPADGRFVISEESFDFENIGRLNFTFDISGYTSDFVKATQDLMKANQQSTDAAKGMAMMGLMQQLSINSLSIRFDDKSITGRVMDYVAKQQGQPREAIAAQVKGMIPLVAMQLQDADFTTVLTTAVSAFVDNPKSLEIKAAPPAAVPVSMLVATGMAQPQALIKQLNLQVIANQ